MLTLRDRPGRRRESRRRGGSSVIRRRRLGLLTARNRGGLLRASQIFLRVPGTFLATFFLAVDTAFLDVVAALRVDSPAAHSLVV